MPPPDAPPPVRCVVHRFDVRVGVESLPASIAVARVVDDAAAHEVLARQWLRPTELTRYRRFLVDSGRRDFLAGRIAAKSALQALAPSTAANVDWEVVSGIWQQPSVRGPIAGLGVTLAHAGGTGVAVAFDDRWAAGVDVESLAHPAIETIRTQVTRKEADWAGACHSCTIGWDTEPARWLALWTAREAFGKILGTGLGLPEALLPVIGWTPLEWGWTATLAGNDSFAIQTFVNRETVTSLVLPAGTLRDETAQMLRTWIGATALA
jgi:4'-phosphopantetheinyl transferase